MSGPVETAVQRSGRLFALLRQAAENGEPCPTDAALAESLGCTEEQVCDGFAFLEAAGMIECHRVITIRAAVATRLAEAA